MLPASRETTPAATEEGVAPPGLRAKWEWLAQQAVVSYDRTAASRAR